MTVRRLHRLVGLMMLLPLAGWALTGFVFFVKPGYAGAYELLNVRTYPMDTPVSVAPRDGWQEIRLMKTVLGVHLLVRKEDGWRQLDPATLAAVPPPDEAAIRRLVEDALRGRTDRYGSIASVNGTTVTTDTGARVTVDWNRLALQQRGRDTDRIDALYRVHYLQWTGVAALDEILGFFGLTLVLGLSVLGARLLWR